MIAPRIFHRDDWERILAGFGCSKDAADDNPPLETGEWWLTRHRFSFIVACDAQGVLRAFDLQQALVQIAKLRPLDLDT